MSHHNFKQQKQKYFRENTIADWKLNIKCQFAFNMKRMIELFCLQLINICLSMIR